MMMFVVVFSLFADTVQCRNGIQRAVCSIDHARRSWHCRRCSLLVIVIAIEAPMEEKEGIDAIHDPCVFF